MRAAVLDVNVLVSVILTWLLYRHFAKQVSSPPTDREEKRSNV